MIFPSRFICFNLNIHLIFIACSLYQGKRVVGEDGIETVNDMYHENTMLQSEMNNLRTRVKAMQETIDTLTQKNTLLLAEKATGTWINSGK